MNRSVKVTLATIATALVASLGIAGMAPSVDAAPQFKDRSWCC
ncbi:hypothetical protein [Nocardioides sp.]